MAATLPYSSYSHTFRATGIWHQPKELPDSAITLGNLTPRARRVSITTYLAERRDAEACGNKCKASSVDRVERAKG
jgi:hypothetical protein